MYVAQLLIFPLWNQLFLSVSFFQMYLKKRPCQLYLKSLPDTLAKIVLSRALSLLRHHSKLRKINSHLKTASWGGVLGHQLHNNHVIHKHFPKKQQKNVKTVYCQLSSGPKITEKLSNSYRLHGLSVNIQLIFYSPSGQLNQWYFGVNRHDQTISQKRIFFRLCYLFLCLSCLVAFKSAIARLATPALMV